MDLKELREQINVIDDEIAKLYSKRMEVSKNIAETKRENNISLENKGREQEIIDRVTSEMPEDIRLYGAQVYDTLFRTSKAYQSRLLDLKSNYKSLIEESLKGGMPSFPNNVTVVCQGIPGAYTHLACIKMIDNPEITFVRDWDAVFNAVEKGLCKYGVLPIENSSVGSVNAVYDLLRKHNCYIVRSTKYKIQHCLLAKKGTNKMDIKEIYSHEQALNQCSDFIQKMNNIEVNVSTNTAVAARTVAESTRNDIACISSKECAEIYGLEILKENIQNNENNYTRFIVISKKLEIFEKANKISIMLNLEHEPGSLNKMLNRFSTLGLNLTKLESRPDGNTAFEFLFYFDFDADIQRDDVKNLIAEIDNSNGSFVFLGAYQEI